MTTSSSRPWLATYEKLGLDWHNIPDAPLKTLSDYVRDHSQGYADREALVYLTQGISYQQLNRLVDQFANLLLSLGCQKGDVLGLQLPNTPQYMIGFIAASRLAMVATSISPLMTPPEIAYQANDSKIRVLVTLEPLYQATVKAAAPNIPTLKHILVAGPTDHAVGLPSLPAFEEQIGDIQVSSYIDKLEAAATDEVRAEVSLDEILYLQYTGGTTGMPKGAKLSSRNLFTNNIQVDVFYGYRTGMEVVASAFPLFHIGGAAVGFNALRTASTLVLIPDPRNIDHFVAEMTARTPTILAAVPALFQMLCQHEGFRKLDFSQLSTAVSGAAPFAEEEVRKLGDIIGHGKFCEVYGMTETSPVQTLNPAKIFKPSFVGVPIPGCEVRIVDAEDGKTEMPLGEPGEIIVSGPQVMSGYLELPDATAKALRQMDGKTWMYTGDIGFMDEDGFVKVCDRSKDMLIVGGYKVFSVEVETRVQGLDWVAMCAVVGRPDEARPGNDIVQLYLQLMPGESRSEEVLREEVVAFCRANLSPYKVPREVFFVDAIPLTSVGKIDKKVLRQSA